MTPLLFVFHLLLSWDLLSPTSLPVGGGLSQPKQQVRIRDCLAQTQLQVRRRGCLARPQLLVSTTCSLAQPLLQVRTRGCLAQPRLHVRTRAVRSSHTYLHLRDLPCPPTHSALHGFAEKLPLFPFLMPFNPRENPPSAILYHCRKISSVKGPGKCQEMHLCIAFEKDQLLNQSFCAKRFYEYQLRTAEQLKESDQEKGLTREEE